MCIVTSTYPQQLRALNNLIFKFQYKILYMSLLSEDASSPAVFVNTFHLTKAEGCPLILFSLI